MQGMVAVASTAPPLHELAERVRPLALRSEQQGLPVLPVLEPLLPTGLTRGSVVSVAAAPGVVGATTLALTVAAGPSRAGAWVALVGAPQPTAHASWGLVAAAEIGVVFERLVVVAPSERPSGGWGQLVAALLDGFPVVVLGPGVKLGAADARRLAARLRERDGVLVRVGGDGLSAQVRLQVQAVRWEGVEDEVPTRLLQQRRLVVEAGGRGAASRGRRAEIVLPVDPGPLGRVAPPQTPATAPAPAPVGPPSRFEAGDQRPVGVG